MTKSSIWVPTRSDTNWPAQSQEQARSFLRFKKMDCSIRVAKTKALISCSLTAQLICAFRFAYVDCWFSDAVDHLLSESGMSFVIKTLSLLK